jgi:hypothetical protein
LPTPLRRGAAPWPAAGLLNQVPTLSSAVGGPASLSACEVRQTHYGDVAGVTPEGSITLPVFLWFLKCWHTFLWPPHCALVFMEAQGDVHSSEGTQTCLMRAQCLCPFKVIHGLVLTAAGMLMRNKGWGVGWALGG